MLINKFIKEGFEGLVFQWKSSWASVRIEVFKMSVSCVRTFHSNINKRTRAASQLCLS